MFLDGALPLGVVNSMLSICAHARFISAACLASTARPRQPSSDAVVACEERTGHTTRRVRRVGASATGRSGQTRRCISNSSYSFSSNAKSSARPTSQHPSARLRLNHRGNAQNAFSILSGRRAVLGVQRKDLNCPFYRSRLGRSLALPRRRWSLAFPLTANLKNAFLEIGSTIVVALSQRLANVSFVSPVERFDC